jgi:hypothetical protein
MGFNKIDTSFGTRPKPFCFILMPFSNKFDDIYLFGLKEIVRMPEYIVNEWTSRFIKAQCLFQ